MDPAPIDYRPVDGSNLRRPVIFATLRVLVATALLLLAYFELPWGHETTGAGLFFFVVALIGFAVALGFQVRRIIDAPIPWLRAAQTLGMAVPIFVVIFALLYVGFANADPANFNQPITRMSALYFTVTVLSTVGFGDIAAQTDGARAVVTVQMLLDLVLIGVLVKVILQASRIGVQRRRSEAQNQSDTDGSS
jgi:hypothetical protein